MSKIFNIDVKRGWFNKTQVEIVRLLVRMARPLSMRAFEETLDRKRLRIYYNLKQLQKRGVVRQDRTGKIYTWALVPEEVGAASAGVPIERAYDFIARSSSQKLWGVQGAGVVEKLLEEIGRGSSFKPIHHRQRLRQIIVDAILTARGVALIKTAPREELSSHLHRPTILHVAPDIPELDNVEVISDGKVVLLTDRARGRATILRDPLAAASYLALHETIKSLSTKVRPQEVYGEFN